MTEVSSDLCAEKTKHGTFESIRRNDGVRYDKCSTKHPDGSCQQRASGDVVAITREREINFHKCSRPEKDAHRRRESAKVLHLLDRESIQLRGNRQLASLAAVANLQVRVP